MLGGLVLLKLHDERFNAGQLPCIKGNYSKSQLWSDYHETTAKAAAVLCLFIGEQHDQFLELVITRRSSNLRSHSGQLSFPGGRKDEKDLSPEHTALREAFEEIALPRESVKTHGYLEPARALDGSLVVPVLATSDCTSSQLHANDEVDEIICIPWPEVSQAKADGFSFNMFGRRRHSRLFRYEGNRIWGLTAGIIFKAAFDISC